MIYLKTPAQIEAMKEAGYLSALVLRKIGELIEPGISTLELDAFAEKFIRSHGGIPAFKGYGGFPGTICASVNEQIVHGIPSKDVILKEGDIVSIDTGATVNGWVGDNAWTYPVGKVSAEKKRLLKAGEECLWAAIGAARAGNRLGDVGYACQQVAKGYGYGVVREYTGHGIGRDMHEDPSVANYGRKHSGLKLSPGLVIAIEPMINAGTHKTRQGKDGWLVCTRDGRPSVHFEKTVAITEEGPVPISVEPDFKRPVSANR